MTTVSSRFTEATRPLLMRYRSWRRTFALTESSALIGFLIVMAELDRLITSSHGADGRSASLSEVLSPGSLLHQDAWSVWAGTTDPVGVIGWVGWHTTADIGFVVAYAFLLHALTRRLPPSSSRTAVVRAVVALVVIDLLEDGVILAGVLIGPLRSVEGFAVLVAVLATAKWACVAAVIVYVLRSAEVGGRVHLFLRQMLQVAFLHRLSVVCVLLITVLALVPQSNIFDQLPDVQRQWIEPHSTGDQSARSPNFDAAAAALATLMLSAVLWLIGRLRSERAWDRWVRHELPHGWSQIGWWLVGPLVAAVSALVIDAVAGEEYIDARSLALFIAVPITLLVVSSVIRYFHPVPWTAAQPGAGTGGAPLGERAIQFGDAVSVLLVCVAGLGLVRSFTAPVFLRGSDFSALDDEKWGSSLAFLLFGFAIALVWPLLARLLTDRVDAWAASVPGGKSERSTPIGPGAVHPASEPLPTFWYRVGHSSGAARFLALSVSPRRRTRVDAVPVRLLSVLLVSICASLLILVALFPEETARGWGVVGLVLYCLTLWSVLLGIVIIDLQRRRPLPVFELIGFRADPVLTLVIVLPLLIGFGGGDPGLHGVRVGTPSVAAPEESGAAQDAASGEATSLLEESDRSERYITSAFASWENTDDGAKADSCTVSLTTGSDDEGAETVNVRPLVVVAVEGGGIRAAYWTAKVMQSIYSQPSCVSDSVLVSSGISGGSLGLALSHQFPTISPSNVKTFIPGSTAVAVDTKLDAAIEHLADPAGLGQAIAGQLVGDAVAGASGVRVTSLVDGAWEWRDRAALLEEHWEDGKSRLSQTFETSIEGPAGGLIINSTDAVSGCRVSILQLAPQSDQPDSFSTRNGDEAALSPASCGSYVGAAASIGFENVTAGAECLSALRWSTVAMLSARFPVVTPAGRLPVDGTACAAANQLQLIDGGYAEASGLNSLSDFTPAVARQVARSNSEANGRDKPFIVPLLLYVRNSTGMDDEVPPGELATEALIPVAGLDAKALQSSPDAWTQRIVADLAEPCGTDSPSMCSDAVDLVYGMTKGPVIVVGPTTFPSVEPPLGWTLSSFSRANLTSALERQLALCAVERPEAGRLADFFSLATDGLHCGS